MTHLVFIFLLFLSSGGDNKREFFSPDKTVLAEVYNFVDTARGEVLESHLRVFTKKGRS